MGLKRTLTALVIVVLASAPYARPATAAPVATSKPTATASPIINVGWRGHGQHHGWHHHGWRHGHRGHFGWGPAIGGFAAGAAIGSAIANSRAQAREYAAYCSQRFKSYDPRSGTYLGYDGLRHPCP